MAVVIMAATRVPAPALFRQGAQVFGSVASVVPGNSSVNEERPYTQISPTSPTAPSQENRPAPKTLTSLNGQGNAADAAAGSSSGIGDAVVRVTGEQEGLISFIA